MRCLLEVLRGEAGTRTVDETEWHQAITLAEEHRVLPFVAETLFQDPVNLPPAIQVRLARARREALHYGFLQSSELRALLQAFAQANIPVLPLKGPLLAGRLYGAAWMRVSCDHDLLVDRVDFARATLLLQTLNFAPDAMPDDYHQKWSRGTTVVELHFDVENPLAIDFDVQSVWKNRQQYDFDGLAVSKLAASDELHYVCLHGVRHRFARLSYVLDIAMAAKQLGHRDDLPSRGAKLYSGADRVLVLGCAMARKLHPEGLPLLVPNSSTNLERLAEKLWSELLTGYQIQQDWASLHQFYLELEPDLQRRLIRRVLHLCILLTRLIDDDFRFAGRFGLKRPWQAWLLRPVRLVLRAGPHHKADSIW